MPDRDTVQILYWACSTIETNNDLHPDYADQSKKGLIDKFVDNGTVSAFYKGWTCKQVKQTLDDIDAFRDSLHDALVG